MLSVQVVRRRESMKLTLAGEAAARDKPRKGGTLLCAKKPPRKKKTKKATSEAGYPLYSTAAGEGDYLPSLFHRINLVNLSQM